MVVPSDELVKTFTADREKARRALSPSQAADQIVELLDAGMTIKELAKLLHLSENGAVFRHLRYSGKIDGAIRDAYLSLFWRPSDELRHSRNQLSLSTFGEVACAIKPEETDLNINRAFALAARYNLSSKLAREINFTMKASGINSVFEAIDKIEKTRGIYSSFKRLIHYQAFLANANDIEMSEDQANKIKSKIESRIGPIVEDVTQIGKVIQINLLPNKVSDEALSRFITAEEVQKITSTILGDA